MGDNYPHSSPGVTSGGGQGASTLDDLSQEKLEYIASHPDYRSILEGLLQPGAENPNGAQVRGSAEHTTLGDSAEHTTSESDSADNTITEDECSTDHTRSNLQRTHRKRADPSSSSLSSSPPRGRKRSRREHSPMGGEPPRKCTRGITSTKKRGGDKSSSMEQCFNPALERDDKEEFKAPVPDIIQKYLEEHFQRPLSKEERTAMLKRHPKPDTEVMVPPKLDSFISDFGGKKLDKARDAQLSKIQGTLLYAANPLTNLWSELINQKLTRDPNAAIPVADILDIIQRSLVLLGNANCLVSEARRENALESIHTSLKKYAKGDFSKAKGALFGEEFKDGLVKKVEADSAISKAVNIVNRSTNNAVKMYQRPAKSDHSFHSSRTSQYGAVSGRRPSPYRYSGKGKFTPGKTYFRKGNIFERLGPNQADKRSGNNPNQQSQQSQHK